MKKLITWLVWIFFNLIMAAIVLLAVLEHGKIMENIFVFVSHVFAIGSLIQAVRYASDLEEHEEFLKKGVVPFQVEFGYDLAIAFFLAANGWFYYATLWLIIGVNTAYALMPTKVKCSCGSGKFYKDCCFGKPLDKTKLYRYYRDIN